MVDLGIQTNATQQEQPTVQQTAPAQLPTVLAQNPDAIELLNVMNAVYLAYEASIAKSKGLIFTTEDYRSLVSTVFIQKKQGSNGGYSKGGNFRGKPQGSSDKIEELKIIAGQPAIKVKIVKSYPFGTIPHYGKNDKYKFDVTVDGIAKEWFATKRNGDIVINYIGKELLISSTKTESNGQTYTNYSIKDGDVELVPQFASR